MQIFKNSQIYDLLPTSFQTVTTQCLSFAINQAICKLLECVSKIGITSSIDELPESILDLLAIELNIPYYNQSVDIKEKQNIIKTGVTYYMKVGSTIAVEKVLAQIFGAAKITEWYEYEGEPFHFKAYVSGVDMNPKNAKRIENSINAVKNVRSVLDEIQISSYLRNNLFHSTKLKTSAVAKVNPYDTIIVIGSTDGTDIINGGDIINPVNTFINAGTI